VALSCIVAENQRLTMRAWWYDNLLYLNAYIHTMPPDSCNKSCFCFINASQLQLTLNVPVTYKLKHSYSNCNLTEKQQLE